ncbi:MAG: S8 family serine peptidase [Candidatus Eremiobacteraeota bacterium]|nr:S8 family serine peptidase [Candidatus Eremiobacteraeota bacterium]
MKRHPLLAAALMIGSALSIGACGGGGSTASPPTSTPKSCGQSVDRSAMISSVARPGLIGLRAPATQAESFAPGTVAVRFAANRVSPEAAAALTRLGAHQMSELNPQGAATFAIPNSLDPSAATAVLRGVRGVVSSGPLIYRHMLSVLPNDPDFATGAVAEPSSSTSTNQWEFFTIQMPNAWGVTTGNPSVRIAVIDSGYDTVNPDLINQVDASIVFDLGNGKQDVCASPQDKDGHGSDVSGIAAAQTNNTTNIAGVGWQTHLLEARVFPYGTNPGASTQDIASAINWAVAAGARVINLSLGSSTPDNTFEEPAIAAAIANGVIVVAAAGNDGKNTVDFPAADPGVIAVGASAYHDITHNVLAGGHEYVAAYSNFGVMLTLVAPGGDPDAAQIKCTTRACIDYLQWIENLDSLQGQFKEQVGLFAGTSQAAPHVAGAVALMVSKDPSLTPAQALSILKSSSDNIGDAHQGAGRLNVLNALNQTP